MVLAHKLLVYLNDVVQSKRLSIIANIQIKVLKVIEWIQEKI